MHPDLPEFALEIIDPVSGFLVTVRTVRTVRTGVLFVLVYNTILIIGLLGILYTTLTNNYRIGSAKKSHEFSIRFTL